MFLLHNQNIYLINKCGGLDSYRTYYAVVINVHYESDIQVTVYRDIFL